jgi:hypothetical protein
MPTLLQQSWQRKALCQQAQERQSQLKTSDFDFSAKLASVTIPDKQEHPLL